MLYSHIYRARVDERSYWLVAIREPAPLHHVTVIFQMDKTKPKNERKKIKIHLVMMKSGEITDERFQMLVNIL